VTQLDGLRRYLEAATTLTQITRGRAEELVRELVASGEVERSRAQDWIDDLIKRSREASETLMSQVSSEVDKQLGERFKDLDLDDLAKRVAGIIELAGNLGRNATSQARDRVVPGHAPNATRTPESEGQPSKPAKQPKSSSNGKAESKVDSKKGDKKDSKKDSGKKKDAESKSAKPAKSDSKSGSKKESSNKSADPGGSGS
jgi:polyhydroxyalkanoate synthesis regulator phasin